MTDSQSSLMAVDVALTPPDWVQNHARAINLSLADGGLVLDETHVPHISLAQFFVMRGAVPLLVERVHLVLREVSAMNLSALAVVDHKSTILWLLDRPQELLDLHMSLMDALKEWEEPDGGPEAFYSDGEPPRDQDVAWVANFRSAASYRKFVPHITLGFGSAPPRVAPVEFVADRVGLYHLGRFCSCRTLLHEWKLR
jgi:2'-5' RNA ligase superfamily protein